MERDLRAELTRALGVPVTSGNTVTPLRNGARIFPAMLDAIAEATTSIDFLTFVYWTGQPAVAFAEALGSRARDGLQVRVLLDAVGARLMDRELVTGMEEAGVDVRYFRPVVRWRMWEAEHRTHRKILVCDGLVGFTGGVGIAEEWEGDARSPEEWRDTHFRFTGPVVSTLEAAFLRNWWEVAGVRLGDTSANETIPLPGPGTYRDVDALGVIGHATSVFMSDVGLLLRAAVAASRHCLRICTAYFAPDRDVIELLLEAVQRGVRVEVIVPGPHIDKRIAQIVAESDYAPLLDGGVTLAAYQPTMLHAKIVLVDGELAIVGSANLNSRSAERDDEVAVALFDEELTAELDRHFDEDLAESRILQPVRWANRSLPQRAREAALTPLKRYF